MSVPPNGAANGSPEANPEPSISWPVNRPLSRGKWTPEVDHEIRLREQKDVRTPTSTTSAAATAAVPSFTVTARELLPGQPRSLSGIGFRALVLGQALGLSFAGALYLGLVSHAPAWRAPFFVTVLATFHFLEFWTTARYNTPAAKTSSFLFSNGKEYQMAHSAAMLEHLVTLYFFPNWHRKVVLGGATAVLGIALIALGQTVRSVAMAQAGTNFNHMVQSRKNTGHQLVTNGVYALFRHPSYFGFFWWGLGTQLMLGNVVCLVVYAAVLWRFFKSRIVAEEKYLINFFGDDYRKYRARTAVAIPLIP